MLRACVCVMHNAGIPGNTHCLIIFEYTRRPICIYRRLGGGQQSVLGLVIRSMTITLAAATAAAYHACVGLLRAHTQVKVNCALVVSDVGAPVVPLNLFGTEDVTCIHDTHTTTLRQFAGLAARVPCVSARHASHHITRDHQVVLDARRSRWDVRASSIITFCDHQLCTPGVEDTLGRCTV